MTAVFLIDDGFVVSEYVQFLAYAFAVSSGLSILVLFPLALLGEALAKRSKHTIWIFPTFLCLGAATLLVIRSVVLKSLLDAVLSWSGLIALIPVVFVLYWVVLWVEKAAWLCWQKSKKQDAADTV